MTEENRSQNYNEQNREQSKENTRTPVTELFRQEEESGFKQKGPPTSMGTGRQNRVAGDKPASPNYHINNPSQAAERMRNGSPGISYKK